MSQSPTDKPPPQVLAIPRWFDPSRGHEVTRRGRGRVIIGPLSWFRSPIHSGESRHKILDKWGESAEERAVFLYERLCELAASQRVGARGKVLDRSGRRPLTLEDIAREIRRNVQWVQEVTAILIEVGWVAWMPVRQRLRGAPNERRLCAAGAQTAQKGAPQSISISKSISISRSRRRSSSKLLQKGKGKGEGENGAAAAGAASGSAPNCANAAAAAAQGRLERLLGMGFKARAAQRLAEQYSNEAIDAALVTYRERKATQTMKNPHGYFCRLLEAAAGDER